MGAWDEHPAMGNDTAADWYSDVLAGTIQSIDGALCAFNLNDNRSIEEARAAIWLLQKLGLPYVYEPDLLDKNIKQAKQIIRKLLKSKTYIESWTNKKEIEDSLQKQLDELEVLHDPAIAEHTLVGKLLAVGHA